MADLGPFFHGTRVPFQKPKLNARGIFWVTPSRAAAEGYFQRYLKTPARVWKVYLKGKTKIVDLTDKNDPIVSRIIEGLGRGSWEWLGDFSILEAHPWVVRLLKSKRVGAVAVRDRVGSTNIAHPSLAVLSMSAVASVVPLEVTDVELKRALSMTGGEMEEEIRAGRWRKRRTKR